MNPFLPSYEYIPDGEAHVFENRIYLYGSHDRFNGAAYCLNDYVSWSAPLDNLSDWRYEGVIFRKDQDPRNQNIPEDAPAPKPLRGVIPAAKDSLNGPGVHAMYAPDVVHGLDGKYYLYYCLDNLNGIGVAVCDKPAGKYEFIGFVRHKDGSLLGFRDGDLVQFDPGLFIEGSDIWLYSGNSTKDPNKLDPMKGAQVMKLENDMVTLKEDPRRLEIEAKGHEYFEASSLRKINGTYYFVYSSVLSHELCYATSDKPDGKFVFRGTLIDIGDLSLQEKPVNCLGNTHGGLECVNGQWYIFYHRQSNSTQFSRQACAEPISLDENGCFQQARISSNGMEMKPYSTGKYPAFMACILTLNGNAVFSDPEPMKGYPYISQDIADVDPEKPVSEPVQYVKDIFDGAEVGFRYFDCSCINEISVILRGEFAGDISVFCNGKMISTQSLNVKDNMWKAYPCKVSSCNETGSLIFRFTGKGRLDMRMLSIQ